MKHLPINLENYEEYFLLYVDNELTEAEKKDVELFIEQHPELREEWMMLMDTKLEPEEIPMDLKQGLYRSEATINESNYEEFQLSWIDDELSEKDKLAIETYTFSHPEAAANFELLSKTKLPAEDIIFPDKSLLYRSAEKPAAVISIKWFRMAVAAAILIAAGLWFINKPEEEVLPAALVTVAQQVPKETGETPATEEKAADDPVREESVIENTTAENNNEPAASSVTRASFDPTPKEKHQHITGENNIVTAADQTSHNSVENVSRNRIDDVVSMDTDPMVSTSTITAQPALALNVKSDYASEALSMEYNANIPDQPDMTEDEKPRKGMFRGIVRKANRIYNKVTNPDPERPLVKVANFEIGLPR